MPFPTRDPETIEAVRGAYERGTLPSKSTAILFSIGVGELYALVRRYSWTVRPRVSFETSRERAIAIRAAEAAHQVGLYGDAATVDDVRILRRRGWVVTREGAGVRVGNRLCTFAQVRQKAARERRLAEAARPVDRHLASIEAMSQDAAPAGRRQQREFIASTVSTDCSLSISSPAIKRSQPDVAAASP